MLPALLLLALLTPWARHTIDNSSRGADGVRLADVNGDGRLDIAVGWEQGATVRIYLHPGPAGVQQPWPATTVGSVCQPEDAVFVDVDGDGRLDAVSACEEGEVTGVFVHWNRADGWKTEHLPASGKDLRWMYSMPMDVDGDGRLDIVSGGKGEAGRFGKRPETYVGWFRSPDGEKAEDLSRWEWRPLSRAGWIMSLVATEWTGTVTWTSSFPTGGRSFAASAGWRIRAAEDLGRTTSSAERAGKSCSWPKPTGTATGWRTSSPR